MLKKLMVIILFCGIANKGLCQNILTNGNMESSTGWNVYYTWTQGTYQFNYTAKVPKYGTGGCLRLTSSAKSNNLFWQKIKLVAGKRYIVDGAVKTNSVTSFFCEFFMSTIAPTNNTDYSPSTGGVVRGLSTWYGCGSNFDALMSVDACTGSFSYTCPGTAGTEVDVYFAIKAGTYSTSFTEVLIDNVSITAEDDSRLLSTEYGTIDQDALKVSGVAPSLSLEKFRNGLNASGSSTIGILDASGTEISVANLDAYSVTNAMQVRVIGKSNTSLYSIQLRPLEGDTSIQSTCFGVLDNSLRKITGLPVNTAVVQLVSAASIASTSSMKIVNSTGTEITGNTVITDGLKVLVTAENGKTGSYILEMGTDNIITETYTDYKTTIKGLTNKIWELNGNCEIHITGSNNPLSGSIINCKSEDIWLYFDSIKPQVVNDNYLKHILINGVPAVNFSNVRLVQYYHGTVIISQSSSYKPLAIYTGDNLSGSSKSLVPYTYYGTSMLGTFNDNVRSFLLKKGYMATFAMDEAGTGYSKVYVASDSDMVVDKLPSGLYGRISYVRVIPWRWVTKKGWTNGGIETGDILNCSWWYDWNNATTSTNNMEYIPMRHNSGWNAYSNIDSKENSTHALGFNEPDRTDQANMTLAAMIDAWPNLLKSGLRLGSPSPSDGGLNLLYSFIDSCDKINYRVDFVAMHYYIGCQTALQFYNRLKAVHDRTKRPIWITEWNNGANWTTDCVDPTYEEQASKIGQFIYMLDTTSFVERYSIYQSVEDVRQMFYTNSNVLTPAGKVYRDKVSPRAYSLGNSYSAAYVPFVFAPINPMPANNSVTVDIDTVLHWENGSPEVPVTSYKVYFGTKSSPSLVSTTTDNFYDPGTLLPNKLYYWRVDVETASGNKTGKTWAFITSNVTGIKDLNTSNKLYIYPNPVTNVLTIGGIENIAMFEIYDLVGKKVLSVEGKSSLDVSSLPKGMYILKMKGFHPVPFVKK
jgi:hypothetical protein